MKETIKFITEKIKENYEEDLCKDSYFIFKNVTSSESNTFGFAIICKEIKEYKGSLPNFLDKNNKCKKCYLTEKAVNYCIASRIIEATEEVEKQKRITMKKNINSYLDLAKSFSKKGMEENILVDKTIYEWIFFFQEQLNGGKFDE